MKEKLFIYLFILILDLKKKWFKKPEKKIESARERYVKIINFFYFLKFIFNLI